MNWSREKYATGGEVEANDCAVRAVAVAFGLPYDDAHAVFKKHGRKDGGGTHSDISHLVITTLADRFIERSTPEKTIRRNVYGFDRAQYPTVHQFRKQHPQGRYVIGLRGHLAALCDGVWHDWRKRSKAKVYFYWKVD